GQTFEEPHVRAGRRELDVAQPFATHLGKRNFDTALVADHPPVLHALVLAAETLPVGDWAETPPAEQPAALRLKGAVIDGLRLGYLAMRPAADFLWRGQADADSIEISDSICQVKGARTIQGFLHFLRLFAAALAAPHSGPVVGCQWSVKFTDIRGS